MAVIQRLDAFQQRHRALGLPLGVLYKFFDDQGNYLAALITYYGFISIVPLFLVLSSALGFVLQRDPELYEKVLESAVSQIPVLGDQLSTRGLEGSGVAVAIGVIGALYGSMGAALAIQNAMNVAWNVPRNSRPNPLLARIKSVALIGLLAVATVLTTVLSQLPASLSAFGRDMSVPAQWIATTSAMVVSTLLFYGYGRIGTGRYVGNRTLLPGAALAAVLWQLLQTFGGRLVGHFGGSTATYGAFGIVLGAIAWIYLASVAMVLCIELNVVLARKLYPRSLLTPLTDDVDLTPADRRAYTAMARAQRLKGFERVTVNFDHDGQNASAKRATEQPGARGEQEEPARDGRREGSVSVDSPSADEGAERR